MVLLLSACSVVDKNTKDVLQLVHSGSFEDAKQLLDKVENDDSISSDQKSEILEVVKMDLIPTVDKNVESFKNDEISVKQLLDIYSGYRSLGIEELTKEVTESERSIDHLLISRTAFNLGEAELEKGNYKKAIDQYKNVTSDDIKYNLASEKIDEAKNALLVEIQKEVKEVNLDSYADLLKAVSHLKEYEPYLKEDERYESLVEDIKELYLSEALDIVDNLVNEKQLDQAEEELKLIQSIYGTTSDISKRLSDIQDEQETKRKQRKEELLTNFDVHYDSMIDVTRIAPKGIDPFNLDIPRNSFVFFPMIQVGGKDLDSGIVAISVVTGFSQSDWIFMDKIIFKANEKRFSWSLSYGERNSQVGGGHIYEWVLINGLIDAGLKGDLEVLANSSSVDIRFDGDNRSRDEKLSKSQIQQIKDTIELYELLNVFGL